ncbi:ABC transporter ATP-binding protein [Psittacicella gerlachiana]|uniref:ABC transporter ATP-binding protein n=2 Tax=Psittacicella gerlachiana TaxID=2028574 RepID=A0A3A1YN01_9GAMM|nr:ABC transporter ATP-binding protein [Psittacicella gerlachiana]
MKDIPVILEGKNLRKEFKIRTGIFSSKKLEAVKDVTFALHAGETISIVGESGSGKSTLAKMILGIEKSTSGEVLFKGKKINFNKADDRELMRKEMQMVFQNPHASLNPRKTIFKILEEPLIYNTSLTAKQRAEQIEKMIQLVGLQVEHLKRYPHMFSGGQKQRIAIARGLILNPSIVVADEAVSALDVSVQAQILNLMLEIQKLYNTSYLFISHDLSVVRHISHRVIVMYRGEVVEYGNVEDIFNNPQHEYTKQLLAAIPKLPENVMKKS